VKQEYSCRQKEETDGADCTSSGRVFQENGGCDWKRVTAGCWQTVQRDVQLQRERRPQMATTWQAWYRNELIQIRWHGTIPFNTQYAVSASLKMTCS